MPPPSEQLQTRSRDEVLAFVYRRGTRLRRQRFLVRSAAVVAVVLAATVPVALVALDGAGPERQGLQVVDMPPTTTPPPPDAPNEADNTTGALGHASASGAAVASQAAVSARSALSPPVAKKSAPVPPSELEACGPGDVGITTITDKPSYLITDTVVVTARIRNTSKHACLPVTSANATIDNEAGLREFEQQKPAPSMSVWQAGQTVEVTYSWTPCDADRCRFMQGRHTVSVEWRGPAAYPTSTTTFTLSLS